MARDERLYPDFTNGLFAWHLFRYLSFFNLRHHPLLQGAKAWITRQTLAGGVPPLPDLGGFQVRRDLVRQAGILLALCRK